MAQPIPAPLQRLVYTSRPTLRPTQQSLEALLCVARPRNHQARVTGLLIATPEAFFQCLEGSREAVGSTMDRIRVDPRHTELHVLLDEAIGDRFFERWDMALARVRQQTWLRLAEARWPLGPTREGEAPAGLDVLATLARRLGFGGRPPGGQGQAAPLAPAPTPLPPRVGNNRRWKDR